jgi:hypothetical protein
MRIGIGSGLELWTGYGGCWADVTERSASLESSSHWIAIAQLLGKQAGIMIGTLTVLAVAWLMVLKVKLRGRIYARFFDNTNYEGGELIKVLVKDAVPTLKSSEDDLDYQIDVATQTQMRYPPGLPVILQEPVQVQHYIRGNNNPYNPRMLTNGHAPGSSAAALTNIKNQEYAKSMVERLNDELGGSHLARVQKILMISVLVMGAGMLIIGYMLYQVHQNMGVIKGALGV